jgi:hypothetical protein
MNDYELDDETARTGTATTIITVIIVRCKGL